MRDNNSQQQFEQHQEQEWWEKNHAILKAFYDYELRPIITGEKDECLQSNQRSPA